MDLKVIYNTKGKINADLVQEIARALEPLKLKVIFKKADKIYKVLDRNIKTALAPLELKVIYDKNGEIDMTLDKKITKAMQAVGFRWWASGCNRTDGVRDLAFRYKN